MPLAQKNFDGTKAVVQTTGAGTDGDPYRPAVGITPDLGALTNRSGTIAVGGTSQQIMAANTSRRYLMVQNPIAASEPLFVNFGAVASAAATSYELAAGQMIEFSSPGFIPTGTVNAVAATGAHAFVAKEGP